MHWLIRSSAQHCVTTWRGEGRKKSELMWLRTTLVCREGSGWEVLEFCEAIGDLPGGIDEEILFPEAVSAWGHHVGTQTRHARWKFEIFHAQLRFGFFSWMFKRAWQCCSCWQRWWQEFRIWARYCWWPSWGSTLGWTGWRASRRGSRSWKRARRGRSACWWRSSYNWQSIESTQSRLSFLWSFKKGKQTDVP